MNNRLFFQRLIILTVLLTLVVTAFARVGGHGSSGHSGTIMKDNQPMIAILVITLRVVGVIVCSFKAKELNRSSGGWGFFGFLMPIVAMIWIQFMKPIIKFEKEN